MSVPKPVVLCILDGWGLRDAVEGNAPKQAQTPHFDAVMQGPHATLVTVSYTHLTLPTIFRVSFSCTSAPCTDKQKYNQEP